MDGPVEIAPSLVRWTAPHPEWKGPAEPGSPDDWDRVVGCVLYEVSDAVVLIDPLLPADGREEFLDWLDRRVGKRPVSILTTVRWHRRDREELAERYRGTSSRTGNEVPGGVVSKPLRDAGEVMYWLVEAACLVPGDALLGDGGGGLRICPESWLDDVHADRRGLAELMRPLLELPIECVLVSHGEPVLHDGRLALDRAIAEAEGRARA